MISPRPNGSALFSKKSGVGVVDLKGLIATSEETLAVLADFRKNAAIKAIVLRIDSPGGAVGAAQEIYEEVKRTNKVKPVVASMGSLAASGGYYAALGTEKIFANPGTLTGSVGVIVKFANLEELFHKIGYKNEVIKSGDLKDIGSPSRPITEAERALLQDLIDNIHSQFVRDVAEHRGLPEDEVRKLADGRIFSGEQAKAAGLIDELGNFTDAALLAAKLGGLDAEELPELIYPAGKNSFLDMISTESSLNFLNLLFTKKHPILSYEWSGNL